MLPIAMTNVLVSLAREIAISRPTATARELAETAIARKLPHLCGTGAWADAVDGLIPEIERTRATP